MPNVAPDLVTTAEASRILGCDVSTVNRWAKSGKLVVVVRGEGPLGPRFYRRSDVEALAAESSRAAS
jgi:predicted site-specific integrase-resolvase